MELWEASAHELGALFRRGETSPREALAACLERIRRHDAGLGCFLRVLDDEAREAAGAAEARFRAGAPLGPLDGVPVAVKDNLCLRGQRATAGSRILENHVATYDAHVVERLRAAGTVIVGKTNLDEFAMGSSNENSAFGPVRNPWDPTRVPGGSSGGSAAAVAAGFVPLALGSDTGGSVRQPAALSGVLGLRPTYGAVSRYGLIAFASSLDQVGPFGRTVRDVAELFRVIATPDPRDATAAPAPRADPAAEIGRGVAGLRIGIPKEYFVAGVEPAVAGSVRAAIDRLERLGARPLEVSLPHTDYGIAAYYVVASAEASSNLARFDGVRYGLRVRAGALGDMYDATRSRGFGAEVKRRIMLGTYTLAAGYYDAYYGTGLKVRTLIASDFRRAFAACDVIAAPTAPTIAFRLGEKSADPLAMYLSDVFTVPSSLAGVPGLSIPCGFSPEGLPIGLQLLAPPFAEARLFGVADALESDLALAPRVAPLGRGAALA